MTDQTPALRGPHNTYADPWGDARKAGAYTVESATLSLDVSGAKVRVWARVWEDGTVQISPAKPDSYDKWVTIPA